MTSSAVQGTTGRACNLIAERGAATCNSGATRAASCRWTRPLRIAPPGSSDGRGPTASHAISQIRSGQVCGGCGSAVPGRAARRPRTRDPHPLPNGGAFATAATHSSLDRFRPGGSNAVRRMSRCSSPINKPLVDPSRRTTRRTPCSCAAAVTVKTNIRSVSARARLSTFTLTVVTFVPRRATHDIARRGEQRRCVVKDRRCGRSPEDDPKRDC